MLTPNQAEWIHQRLLENGYKLSGDMTITHETAWSHVATITTSAGKLFFKVTKPALIFEVRLTEALYQWGMLVPKVVAVDAEKGWLLLADSGQALRSLLQADGDMSRWHKVVAQYAQMQIALVDRADALLEIGVFDRRLSQLPLLYHKLLADRDAMLLDQENGLSTAEYGQLQQFAPEFAKLCQRLTDYGIPETLHHDDFHDNNIFVQDGVYRIADWGEACLAHPFFSMIIVLRIAAYILKLEDDDPALVDLRDTYLAQWRAYGTDVELRQAFDLAQSVGAVSRALTWHTMLGFMNAEERAEEADSVPGWLQEFLSTMNK